jgi:hypothetical protein
LLNHSIETGPLTSKIHEIRIDARAKTTTSGLSGPRFVDKAVFATLAAALPSMIASMAFHPIAMRGSRAKTTRRVPFEPNTLLKAVYCSRPYLADGMQGARATRLTPITLPIKMAAIPALAPTKRAVVPPMRNAQVAIASPTLTAVKSQKP